MTGRRGDGKKDCARAAQAIADFGDGNVSRLRWVLLRRHVKDCPECGAYLNRMSAVLEALAQMQDIRAPEHFAALVMRRLLEGPSPLAGDEMSEPHGRRNLLWVLAAGLGVLAAVGLAVVRWAVGRYPHKKLAVAGPA